MKTLMTSTIAAILLAGIASAETVTLRVECRKDSDRGCTASGRACSAIGDSRYIVPGSPSGGTVQNYWSKNPRCGAPEADGYVAVPDTGLPYPPSYATQVCASLHVESGSGFANLGKVAFVNCNYQVRTFAIE